MLYIGIPAYNEATTIGVLLWRLRSVLAEVSREYEVVVYDDASTDDTTGTLAPYSRVLPLTILRGTQRLGYAGAMDALVRYVSRTTRYPRRDALLLLQGDFTDPPVLVPEFLRRFEGGADLVLGERMSAGDAPAPVRRLWRASRWVLRPFVGVSDVSDLTATYRLTRIALLRDMLKASGDAPVAAGDSWSANADFLLKAAPLARRIETIPVTPTYGIRTRDTRRSGWPDAIALAKWGWAHRGARVAAKVIARNVDGSDSEDLSLTEAVERSSHSERRERSERGERADRAERASRGSRAKKRSARGERGAAAANASAGARADGDHTAGAPVPGVEGVAAAAGVAAEAGVANTKSVRKRRKRGSRRDRSAKDEARVGLSEAGGDYPAEAVAAEDADREDSADVSAESPTRSRRKRTRRGRRRRSEGADAGEGRSESGGDGGADSGADSGAGARADAGADPGAGPGAGPGADSHGDSRADSGHASGRSPDDTGHEHGESGDRSDSDLGLEGASARRRRSRRGRRGGSKHRGANGDADRPDGPPPAGGQPAIEGTGGGDSPPPSQ